jgi:hypothetical protein
VARTGLFISYRRSDSLAWAGRLFGDLAREFGSPQVFMDINGSIPRGAKFDDTIHAALADCNALLALIGPQWVSCTRKDGRRRLDVADDWVRAEIAAALKRDIIVVPVLLGQAKLPDLVELPEDIHGLRRREAAELTDSRWDYDVGKLIEDLGKITPLRRLRADVTSAGTGLRLLKDLASGTPDVADAVSRSKEVIETTQRQLDKLEVFKRVHDALHTIEASCLRPMRAVEFEPRVRQYRAQFATEMARIQDVMQGDAIDPALRSELVDQMGIVTGAFQAVLDTAAPREYKQLVGELTALLSGIPSRLDQGIVNSVAGLSLDRLVDLMVAVQGKLPIPASGPDASLQPLLDAIEALKRLRAELTLRVNEHTLLQSLDSKLRAVCEGGSIEATAVEWTRIKRARSRLNPPYSPEVAIVTDDLSALEKEIDVAASSDGNKARPLIDEYFRMINSTFRSADQALLKFSDRLSDVSEPLKAILAIT